MISWFSFSRTNSTNAISSPVLIMSWSVLIVNTFWCSVFILTRQEELRHLSVHNLTWQAYWSYYESCIIFLSKVKLCKSCLSKCNWFVVWLRMTSEFFHPLSHLLRNEKAVGQISLFLRSAIINGYCLSRSTILAYTPIVVQNRGLKVIPSWFSAFYKYIEMSSESLSTIRDDWDVRFE